MKNSRSLPSSDLGLTPLQMKRELMKHLVDAAILAFRTTFSSTVAADRNFLLKPVPLDYSGYDFVSFVDVLAHKHRVGVRLCLKQEVLVELTSRLVGGRDHVTDELVQSIPTELLNLIYGGAKSHLNDENGLSFPSAIPQSVSKSRFHNVERGELENLSVIPLVTPLGSLDMEVYFK